MSPGSTSGLAARRARIEAGAQHSTNNRGGGVERAGERVAVRAAPEARVDDGPAARGDLAARPAAELGRGEGVEVDAIRAPAAQARGRRAARG